MLFMVWIRTLFPTKTIDSSYLKLLKTPQFTVVLDNHNAVDTTATNAQVSAFFKYTNYTDGENFATRGDYQVELDRNGPLYFNPPNCNVEHSIVLSPKVASPIIGVIGE
jgi:hypothetical protein